MSRNLKALGLALVAVFAMSAIASTAASATEATFTSSTNWTTLDVSALTAQKFKIEGEAEEVSCSSFSLDNATVGTDQKEVTGTPTYGKTLADGVTEAEATTSECTILAGGVVRPATIHPENCHFTLTAGSTNATSDGEIHITETGLPTCEIKITIYFLGSFKPCFDVHDQTPTVPTVDYTNGTYVPAGGGANKWDVTVKSTVKGITYKRTGVCIGAKPEESNNAEYTGEVTVKGTDTEGKAADVTWDKKT